MELHSEGFEDFTGSIIKCSKKTKTPKRDVSKFIKSALASDPPQSKFGSSSPPRPAHRLSEGGHSGKRRAAANPDASSSKKRRKIGTWNHLLSEVKWPGLEEQEPADNEIDSYSDEESQSSNQNEDEILSYSEEEGVGVRCEGASKWRRTIDLLQTSTPVQGVQSDKANVECISDFESLPSSDSDTSSPHTPTHTPHTLHISHKRSKAPKRLSSIHQYEQSAHDHDLISTPPSSPEVRELDRTPTGTKPSDWLKGVSMETETSHVTESDLNSTSVAMKTPLDSAKKIRTKRGRRKFVEGGLAEQLERVVSTESVEVTFWEHKVKGLQDNDINTSICLTVELCMLVNCYSLFVASCRLVHGVLSSKTTEATPTEVAVLFSQRCAKNLNLKVGSRVRIHPPWQCLTLPSLSKELILCAPFCQSLGHTPSLTTPTSPVPCKQRGVTGVLSVSAHLRSPVPKQAALTRSPVKSLPMVLFEERDQPTAHPHGLTSAQPHSLTSTQTGADSLPDAPQMLLDGIEHAQCGLVGGVTGRVVRVYRRSSQHIVHVETQRQLSVQRSLLLYDNERSKVAWCLLMCDAAGMFAEVQLSEPNHPEWSKLIQRGEGEVVHCTDLKLLRRTSATRSPELISLISSLKLHPSPHPPAATDGSQLSLSTFPPSFCYVLRTSQTTPPYIVTPHMGHMIPTVEGGRLDLLARVVYCSQCTKDEEMSAIQRLSHSTSGGYLHTLTPSHPHTSLLTLQLKPSFPTDGLADMLSTPGVKVQLRGVCRDPNCDPEYWLDSCSLILPVHSAHTHPSVYPVATVDEDDISLLDSLSSPDLPTLDQEWARPGRLVTVQGRVVSVDEDNAYSWPVCDRCGNSQLTEDSSELYCDVCEIKVTTPDTHLHLAVVMNCKSLQSARVHVMLLQDTVKEILPLTADSVQNGFDVHQVLGKCLQLSACHVDKVTHNADGTTLLWLTEILYT